MTDPLALGIFCVATAEVARIRPSRSGFASTRGLKPAITPPRVLQRSASPRGVTPGAFHAFDEKDDGHGGEEGDHGDQGLATW
jgi:hypothetical protein